MTSRPRDLETGEPILDLTAYEAQVQSLVAPYIDLIPTVIAAQTVPETLETKIVRMRTKWEDRQLSAAALADIMGAPEDPRSSLGTGDNTYRITGSLLSGLPEDSITQRAMRGRGGVSITRLTLGGKIIDVPVLGDGRGSHSDAVYKARQDLLQGKGSQLRRSRQ